MREENILFDTAWSHAGLHEDGYNPDYVGFSLPDEFVVGYGLDYNQKFRDLDRIAVLSPSGIERHKE